ncbi:2OG-Fe(II) oxygenase [Acidithiobacillus ferrivorans]|nr:2OG-Fe(II) oxygenase [Acidithiobacillus ferrivorans]
MSTDMQVHIIARADVGTGGVNATIFAGLILPVECAALINLAKTHEKPALICDAESESGGLRVDAVRTNRMAWVPQTDALVMALDRRIAQLTGLPLENQEPLQVLHYMPGEEYLAHFDAFPESNKAKAHYEKHGGNRIATVILYLNTVAQGGATSLPELGLSVHPHPGLGLFFKSVDSENGQILQKSLHAGDPVVNGEKWIATKWIRERAYV